MCGLVAVLSTKNNGFSYDEGEIFAHSMIFNQLRGDDSTGAVCIDNTDSWRYLKSVGGWKNFTRHKQYDDWKKYVMSDGRLVFGHGRAATRGLITIDNAHPFHIKDKEEIIFTHNGTLENSQNLPGFHAFPVDSEYLGTMIARHGPEKALSEVYGAIACMWWNVQEGAFYFYHNKERPLHFMYLPSGEFYINSEKWILEYLNWKFKLKIPDKNIYAIDEDKLHKIQVNGDKAGKYIITKITQPKRAVVVYNHDYNRFNDHNYETSHIYPPEDKEFWNRDISMIEWLNGNKIVTFRDKNISTTTYMHEQPPEPGLVRMYECIPTGNVMKVYIGNDGKPIYISVNFQKWKEEKENKNKATQPRIKEAPEGAIWRFTTRLPNGKKVKHRGVEREGSNIPHLKSYMNTVDGNIQLNTIVTIELLWTEEAGTLVKCIGSEIKEKQDTYIDYVFYTAKFTKQEVEKIRFFKGKVGSIKIATPEERKISGAVCVCSLYDVDPVTNNSDKPTDEIIH